MKFNSFVVKIVSPCNLNCTYCYEYNGLDTSWKNMPKYMSIETAKRVADRIREHLLPTLGSNVLPVSIILHGGEPLMMNISQIQKIVDVFKKTFAPELKPIFGIQTNGLLLTDEHIEMMNREQIHVGISCDGPPKINDKFRINHSGKGSGKKVQLALNKLSGQPCFKTILSVIDIQSDPIEVYEYLSSFRPKAIDFLLPHGTYDRRPAGKLDLSSTLYADWLITVFDRWFYNSDGAIRIRIFEELMENICGGMGSLESFGLKPVTLLVVSSDGSFEGVDTLKVVGPGEHVLDRNAFDHSLDEVSLHPKVTMRQMGELGLCATCKGCEKRRVCGGGYLPHRHSSANGFANPSLFCKDLYKLILHIESSIHQFLNRNSIVTNSFV